NLVRWKFCPPDSKITVENKRKKRDRIVRPVGLCSQFSHPFEIWNNCQHHRRNTLFLLGGRACIRRRGTPILSRVEKQDPNTKKLHHRNQDQRMAEFHWWRQRREFSPCWAGSAYHVRPRIRCARGHREQFWDRKNTQGVSALDQGSRRGRQLASFLFLFPRSLSSRKCKRSLVGQKDKETRKDS